jgi:hypothetical protein
MNAVMALMGRVFEYDDSFETLVWINGLGTVVEQEDTPNGPGMYGREKDIDTASTVSYDGWWCQIASMHPKDRRYRGRMDWSKCLFDDCKQFFPFQHSASQILRYLMWVLDEYNPAPYIRRERYVCAFSCEEIYLLTCIRLFDNSRLKCECNEDECDF